MLGSLGIPELLLIAFMVLIPVWLAYRIIRLFRGRR
jgi:hypothetical protein